MQFNISSKHTGELSTPKISNVIVPYRQLFDPELWKLKAKGIKKVGVILQHIYYVKDESKLQAINLRGKDLLVHELFKKYCKKIEFCKIAIEGNDSYSCKLYRHEILEIIKISEPFNSLYMKTGKNNKSDFDEEVHYDEDKYDDIKLNYSKNNFIAIKKEYLIGDVLFLKTNGVYNTVYESISEGGYDEIHLGNGGFSEKITRNLAMIFHLW
jgi:hypothetical protein